MHRRPPSSDPAPSRARRIAPRPAGAGRRRQPVAGLGNRATRSLVKRVRGVAPPRHLQRAWKRIKRDKWTSFLDDTGANADNIDIIYGDGSANPPHIIVKYRGGAWTAYKYENRTWQQDFAARTDALLEAAQAAAPLVQLPAGARTHIFDGTIEGNSHTGLHTARNLGEDDTVVTTAADGNGIYAANVTKAGQTVAKASLMFPTAWDLYDIADAVANAIATLQPGDINGLRYGYSGPGITGFFVGLRFSGGDRTLENLDTAFPIQYNGATPTNQELVALF